MKWSLYALVIGCGIDLMVGDPHGMPHPVVGIGKLISLLEALFRRLCPKTKNGEILAGAEFYTYDDKYKNGVSQTVIPAHLSEEKLDEVRTEARRAYLALGCAGLSRCDFFVERGTGRVLCNELNTLPGFTPISMYPKLMEHEGYSYPALVDKLLQLALHRRKGAY